MAEEPAAPAPREADDEPSALEQRAAEVLHAAEEVAAATGRAMVSEAKGVRRRILQDATRRRTELVSELERVRGLLDRALEALRVPVETQGPPAHAAPVEQGPDAGPAGAEPAADLFARLRAAEPAEAPAPVRRRAAKRVVEEESADPESATVPDDADGPPPDASGAEVPDASVADTEVPGADAPDQEPEDPDDVLRRRRDAVIDPLVPDAVRAAKRVLQDEQNSLLDAIRRARGRYEPSRLLPPHEHQRETWLAILTPSMDAAFNGGRAASGKTRRAGAAPARVVGQALAMVVTGLRDRLAATIESVVAEGPYETPHELHRALGSAIGARYREWKGAELEARLRDAACAAYARGSFEAAGAGTPLRWVPADPGQCPDCDDNALEPTIKGSAFPTGQSHPPAHPGCRCLVVPLERGGEPAVTA